MPTARALFFRTRRRVKDRLPASLALRASLAPQLSSGVGLTRHPRQLLLHCPTSCIPAVVPWAANVQEVQVPRRPGMAGRGLKWTSCPFAPWTTAAFGGSLHGSRSFTRRRVVPRLSSGRRMLCLSPVREPPQKWAGPGVEWTGSPFEAARYTDVSEADPRGSRFLRAVPQGPVQRDSSTASVVPRSCRVADWLPLHIRPKQNSSGMLGALPPANHQCRGDTA